MARNGSSTTVRVDIPMDVLREYVPEEWRGKDVTFDPRYLPWFSAWGLTIELEAWHDAT